MKNAIWEFYTFFVKPKIYLWFYGINMKGINQTIIPITGKGKYVSVYSKGEIIQIKHESGYENILTYDEIRIVPYKYNHGKIYKW